MSGMVNIVQLILRLDSVDKLISCKELAKELNVSERQVRNYIQILRELGIEVEGDQAIGGGYSGRKMGLRIPWEIQEKEVHALNRAIKRLEHDDMYKEYAELKSLGLKLASRMNSNNVNHLVRYRDRITGVHAEGESELILQIEKAICRQNKVKLLYHSPNSRTVKERVVHPYALEGYHHGMYMKGFCEEADGFRNFKLNRILEFECMDEMFELKKWVEDKVKEDGFGIFRQREYVLVADVFYPFNTYIQEVKLGEDQKNEIIDKDTTRIRVTLNNIYEVVSILLGFGSKVKIIEPDFIRDEIVEEAKKIIEMNG